MKTTIIILLLYKQSIRGINVRVIWFPVFVVAEPGYRRRGMGIEAARLMMAFGKSVVNPVFITVTVATVFWCVAWTQILSCFLTLTPPLSAQDVPEVMQVFVGV